MANLTALGVARDRTAEWRRGVVCGSGQTHSSVWKACRILGLPGSQQRRLPANAGFRIEISALEAALRDDAAKGRPPIAIVANAGTANTGAVDPSMLWPALRRSGAWLHVDGAYGLAAILDLEARTLLSGAGRADSISLDPHKWWFQPHECGVVLCRNGRVLERTDTARAEYLTTIDGVPEEPSMCDRSVQLSRRVAGLKFWASIKVFGMDAFAQAVRTGIRLAEHAQRRIEASSQWTLVSGAQLAVVTFRHVDGDGATEAAVARANATGTTFLATTSVRGQTAARFCTINPRTTKDDIDAVLAAME